MPNSLATLEKFAVSHKVKQNYHTTQQSKSYVFTQMEQKHMLNHTTNINKFHHFEIMLPIHNQIKI